MKNKYRIVTDSYAGYEVQIKRWWLPFWHQCDDMMGRSANSHFTVEEAKEFIEKHKTGRKPKVVFEEE